MDADLAAAHNRADETGATYDVYWLGIDIPPGLSSPAAPSRHSGDSSLSPQDPEITMKFNSFFKNTAIGSRNSVH